MIEAIGNQAGLLAKIEEVRQHVILLATEGKIDPRAADALEEFGKSVAQIEDWEAWKNSFTAILTNWVLDSPAFKTTDRDGG